MKTIVEQKELFEAVQLSGIFEDSKSFPDMIALRKTEDIAEDFNKEQNHTNKELSTFVLPSIT